MLERQRRMQQGIEVAGAAATAVASRRPRA